MYTVPSQGEHDAIFNIVRNASAVDFIKIDETASTYKVNNDYAGSFFFSINKGQTIIFGIKSDYLLVAQFSETDQQIDMFLIDVQKDLKNQPKIEELVHHRSQLFVKAFFKSSGSPKVIGSIDSAVSNVPLQLNVTKHNIEGLNSASCFVNMVNLQSSRLSAMANNFPTIFEALIPITPNNNTSPDVLINYMIFVPSFVTNDDSIDIIFHLMLGYLGSNRQQIIYFIDFWLAIDTILTMLESAPAGDERREIFSIIESMKLAFEESIIKPIKAEKSVQIQLVDFDTMVFNSISVAKKMQTAFFEIYPTDQA